MSERSQRGWYKSETVRRLRERINKTQIYNIFLQVQMAIVTCNGTIFYTLLHFNKG